MGRVLTIAAVCGAGWATSTVLREKIESIARKGGVLVRVVNVKAAELAASRGDWDLVVSAAPVSGLGDIPVINGMPLLTGLREQESSQELLEHLYRLAREGQS